MSAAVSSLTPKQRDARKIGGSDAPVIANGVHYGKTLYHLWLEKTGRVEPEDLSNKFNVFLGIKSEEANREWYEQQTGNKVEIVEETLVHPDYSYITANLDGIVRPDTIFEAKHTSAFNKASPDTIHYPQVQHYLGVTGFELAHICVIKDMSWSFYEVERNDSYIVELIQKESAFWWCVTEDIEPDGAPTSMDAPVILPTKTVDMNGNNEWASSAVAWIENYEGNQKFTKAKSELKKLVGDDVALAAGHGVQAERKNGKVYIKREKEREIAA